MLIKIRLFFVYLDSPNNFPPFPKFCPCKPCFHQDIRLDIPQQFQRWVRMLFYLWLRMDN